MQRAHLQTTVDAPPPAHAEPASAPILAASARAVDAYLGAWLPTVPMPQHLTEAVTYALLGGGKRLRPALCQLAAAAVSPAAAPRALPAAAALELVHAFSLVHDDLPAMDDDDLRRGRPTLHIHAGEAMAILAGDAMLTLAFAALSANPPGEPPYPPVVQAALTRELASSTLGMIAGQVYDTLGGFAPELTPSQRVRLTHENKTGALIRASCRMGVTVALGTDDTTDPRFIALSDYGDAVGLMFQIVDDLIDVEQPSGHVGKRTRKDADAGKLTYPGVLGVERSRTLATDLARRAAAAIAPLGPAAADLTTLCHDLIHRTK